MISARTNEELKEISEHLYYELTMLIETSKLRSEDRARNNAFLESFCIHARVMRDFLFNIMGHPDDAFAIDFFDDHTEWKKYIRGKSEVLSQVNGRVNKEIVHLSYRRLKATPEEKFWDQATICREINEIFKRFLELVSEEKICEELKEIKHVLAR